MHLYVIAKGIKPHLDTWVNELLAQKLPKYKDGKPLVIDGNAQFVQLAVRPVQLYEIGFPREHLEWVMANVGTGTYILNRYPKLKWMADKLRKLLKLKPVPIPKKVNALMQPTQMHKAVAVIPIGIKEDMIRPADHTTNPGEEML